MLVMRPQMHLAYGLMTLVLVTNIRPSYAQTQVTPDQTLQKRSRIRSRRVNGRRDISILGGVRSGRNLFHSFSEFNIGSRDRVSFIAPKRIDHIISRVSSRNASKILGSLGVSGNADLIFLNKNGITFEKNASLNLNGSVLFSTADSLAFESGGILTSKNSIKPSLFDNRPVSLRFNRQAKRQILISTNRSVGKRPNFDASLEDQAPVNLTGLRVSDRSSLLLVGGDVILNDGGLNALGGTVAIASVSKGKVSFNLDSSEGVALEVLPNSFGSKVLFSNDAVIDVSGSNVNAPGGGVQIISKDTVLNGARLISQSSSVRDGLPVNLVSFDTIRLDNGTKISTLTSGEGDSGDILFDARKFKADGVSQVTSSALQAGNGGDIRFNLGSDFQLSGADIMQIEGRDFSNPTGIFSNALGEGDAGNISVRVQRGNVLIQDGAILSASSSRSRSGRAGNIFVRASDLVKLSGDFPVGTRGIRAGSSGFAPAGDINIYAKRIKVSDGNQISAGTSQIGEGGNVVIFSEKYFFIDNGGQINLATQGEGIGGNLEITTPTLSVQSSAINVGINDGSDVGTGGELNVNADHLHLNDSFLGATTGQNINNRNVAKILLNVSNSLRIDKGSLISAEAVNQASGGNILIINTPNLSAKGVGEFFDGNDIIANSEGAEGGNIIINANQLIGDFKVRNSVFENRTNDIDASGRVPGVVDVNTTTKLNQGLIELPQAVIDPDALISQNPCSSKSGSDFRILGRGGGAQSAQQKLGVPKSRVNPVGVYETSQFAPKNVNTQETQNSNAAVEKKILSNFPASGWAYDKSGKIKLSAHNSKPYSNQRTNNRLIGICHQSKLE